MLPYKSGCFADDDDLEGELTEGYRGAADIEDLLDDGSQQGEYQPLLRVMRIGQTVLLTVLFYQTTSGHCQSTSVKSVVSNGLEKLLAALYHVQPYLHRPNKDNQPTVLCGKPSSAPERDQ